MILFHAVQLATDLYLKDAYPQGPPPQILKKVEALHLINDTRELLDWDGFEFENNRYSLRLGNNAYPHMKLVFVVQGDCHLFYVDAHDSHFTIAPSTPGFEGLLALRNANKSLKKTIEAHWLQSDLPVFGAKIPANCKTLSKLSLEVLALDDEPQILDMLTICGAGIGLKVRCATSVRQAVKSIQERRPDVVLCDIMMPEESGDVLVHWMQEHYPQTPIFYITGRTIDAKDTSGVRGILQKPFTLQDLSKALGEIKPTV